MEEAVFYNLSQDATLGGDSPSIHKIPSQAALKAYIDAKAGSGGPNYFYVEDASGAANTLTIKKSVNALADKVFEWSYDKATWTEITITDNTGESIPIAANGRVYLRGDNGALANASYNITIDCSAIFNAGGDVTCLIVKSGRQAMIPYYAFKGILRNSKLLSAADMKLPAITLATSCYQNMFQGCTLLTTAPALPATTLETSCYNGMFQGCTSLTTAPALPAITLATSCYNGMFQGCTSLTTAPALPAITLATSCYNGMFKNCTSLTTAPALPAITLATSCYIGMFSGCTNINSVIVSATSWNTSNAFNWLYDVSPTGDFYNLGGATIPTGTDGIPSGWTEHTQLP